MPRQNDFSHDELEQMFEGYLADQNAGRPVDAFALHELEDTDNNEFDYMEQEGRPPEATAQSLGIQTKIKKISGPGRNLELLKRLGKAQ